MNSTEVASIAGSVVISLIAALSGRASSKAASRASITNTSTSSRVEMEKEAYERARKLDTETIQRQDDEMDEMRLTIRELKEAGQARDVRYERLHHEHELVIADNARLREEVRRVRQRFTRIERQYPTDEIPIRERASDLDPTRRDV
jgi:TolA-binding protein